MKILVVGGTGRISLALVKLLVEEKHDVFCINRGKKSEPIKSTTTFISDINDKDKINGFLKDKFFDCIIDFISYTKEDIKRAYKYFKNKTNQYIFVSSVVVYKHDKNKMLDEDSERENLFWDYAKKKIEAEDELFKIAKKDKKFTYTVFRSGHTFDSNAIPTCFHGNIGTYEVLYRIMHNKPVIINNTRSIRWKLMYNKDWAKGVLPLLGNEKTYNKIYNICSSKFVTWDEIYETIGKIVGKKAKIVHVDTKIITSLDESQVGPLYGDKDLDALYSSKKIEAINKSYINETPFEESLKETIANILNNKNLRKRDKEFSRLCKKIIKISKK